MSNVNIRNQRTIIEHHDGDWMVMHPNGDIEVCGSPEQALTVVQRRAKRGNTGITLTHVEWRGVPEGWTPPQGGAR